MSYCPACGSPAPEASARFCMKCGRELPASPPPAPPAPPTPTYAAPVVPPAYAPTAAYPGSGPAHPSPPPPPGPQTPSPAGLFTRRVFAGPWDSAVLAAVVPAIVLLVLAGGLGSWSQHALRGSAVSWLKRTRIALALAVQGLGGHLSAHEPSAAGGFGSDCSDYYGDDDDYTDDGGMCESSPGSASLAVVPMTFTLVWLLALILVLRSVRRRQSGPAAAVRVALLSAVAATALSFFAQPGIHGTTLHSGPFRVLLWSFLLSLATALVVLDGPALRARFAAAWRVAGSALIALLVTVAIATLVVLCVAVGHYDEMGGGNALLVIATVLPNLGLSGLALGWGAPFKVSETSGNDSQGDSLHLSDLSHFWNGWATVLAVVGGVLCALIIGLLASARSRDRAEQFAVAGVFTVALTALVAIGGLARSGSSSLTSFGDGAVTSQLTAGSAVPETLLFALLWSVGGVLVAPYVRGVLGLSAPAQAHPAAHPYGPPSPYAPPPYVPPQPSPVHDLGIVQPDRLSKEEGTRGDEGGGRHL